MPGLAANTLTVADILRAAAAEQPHTVSIVDGRTDVSRAAFVDAAVRFASQVARMVPAGRPVGLYGTADVDFAVTVCGCIGAGIPFITLDPHDPAVYQSAILTAAAADAVVEHQARSDYSGRGLPLVRLSGTPAASDSRAAIATFASPSGLGAAPNERGATSFVSSSETSLLDDASRFADDLALQSHDRVMTVLYAGPLAGVRDLLASLWAGARYVMRDARSPLSEIVRTILDERITVLSIEAAVVYAIVHAKHDLSQSALRVVHLDDETLSAVELAALSAILPANCRLTPVNNQVRSAANGRCGRTSTSAATPHSNCVRGRRIDLDHLATIVRQCPGVSDAAAIVALRGESQRLVAFVVAATGMQMPTRTEIRRWLKLRVPDWMVPGDVRIVDGIMRTASGAPDLQTLLRLAAVPNPRRYFRIHAGVRQNDAARAAVDIWSSLLGTDALLADERWDEAGGDALQLVEFGARLDHQLGRPELRELVRSDVRPRDLLELLADRERSPANSGRRIVVLLPGLDGDNIRLVAFRAHFAPANHFVVPAYPQWPDIVSRNESLTRIIDIVVDQIVPQLDGRPVTLVGYSFGGLVAHEVAGRLGELGIDVCLVAILDCDVMQGPLSQAEARLRGKSRAATLARDIQVAGLAHAVGVRVAFRLAGGIKRSRLLRQLAARHRRRLPLPSEIAVPFDDWMTRWAREIAARSWKPRRHATNTIVFRCKQQTSAFALPDLGWSRYTNVLAVKEIGGSHLSMLSGDHSGRLAHAVQREFIAGDEVTGGLPP